MDPLHAHPPRHFLSTLDWSRAELEGLLDDARRLRDDRKGVRGRSHEALAGKSIALLFFNPSLRTRTTFELGAHELGAKAIVLEPGKGAWPIEFEELAGGATPVMDKDPEEHVRDVAQVLSRYVDAIAVRAFPKFQDWSVDREDRVVQAFARYATVPVINMETITHPCQELALAMALQDRWESLDGKKLVVTWTYHPKPLNTAVANSGVLIGSKMGFDVTLLCPTPDYLLDERYLTAAERSCKDNGRTFRVSHDIDDAYRGAHVVYAKSWGALPYFGRFDEEKPLRERFRHFMVDMDKMNKTDGAVFSHCLPVRRNVKVTDEVLDSPRSIHIDEAECRLHVQKALMKKLMGPRV